MARVAITDGMDEKSVNRLIDAGHEVIQSHYETQQIHQGALRDFDAVVIRSATKLDRSGISSSVIEGGKLGFIGRAGVGVDNIDIDAATEFGIVVCNTPGASTQSVAELTIGHLIASTRHITTADKKLKNGEWAKKELRGSELGGKNLGLIGYGRIARRVAQFAKALGMKIHAFDPYVDISAVDESECIMHEEIDDLFETCTHISIHCNLTDETKHLVNSRTISMMPSIGSDGIECGNHIVNCSRGGIVDESAATFALENGILSSLALDVYEEEPLGNSPLLNLEKFHGTPHIAASTFEAQERIGSEMVDLLIEYLEGNTPKTALN